VRLAVAERRLDRRLFDQESRRFLDHPEGDGAATELRADHKPRHYDDCLARHRSLEAVERIGVDQVRRKVGIEAAGHPQRPDWDAVVGCEQQPRQLVGVVDELPRVVVGDGAEHAELFDVDLVAQPVDGLAVGRLLGETDLEAHRAAAPASPYEAVRGFSTQRSTTPDQPSFGSRRSTAYTIGASFPFAR
jgi:hypothetical protein